MKNQKLNSFSFLRAHSTLRIDLAEIGEEAFPSFAKACVASGIGSPATIIALLRTLCDNPPLDLEFMIEEGENLHWAIDGRGHLLPLPSRPAGLENWEAGATRMSDPRRGL